MMRAVSVPVTDERRAEFGRVLARATAWARAQAAVRALGLVGSWARAGARMDSDIDLVVLTDTVDAYRTAAAWVTDAAGPGSRIVRSAQWGPLTERRVALASGLEVEFGFAPTSWACAAPLDGGTAAVVRDALHILYDPDGLLGGLIDAVGGRSG